ncbi:DUF427 domain-containing protein [Rhizobium cremeum]|uniref:DUF427 domain-containing protein n=1 Tax=Rhizobium cremeum TaxID=2813827 RepID=UPI000DDEF7A7
MQQGIMRVPDGSHPIIVEPIGGHVVVVAGGKVVADTLRALNLREANLPSVLYIPRRDVDMTVLKRSPTSRYCPYKGEASYFSIAADDAETPDGAWIYDMPHWAVCEIEDHVAFDPDLVECIEVLTH